jgi:hypothetical protein
MVAGMLNTHPQDSLDLVEKSRQEQGTNSFVKFYEAMLADENA